MSGEHAQLSGFLQKSKRVGVGWDRRWFELRTGELRYFEERGSIDLSHGSAKADSDATTFILEASLKDAQSGAMGKKGGDKVKMKIRAPSQEVRDQWVEAVAKACGDGAASEKADEAVRRKVESVRATAAAPELLSAQEAAARGAVAADAAWTLCGLLSGGGYVAPAGRARAGSAAAAGGGGGGRVGFGAVTSIAATAGMGATATSAAPTSATSSGASRATAALAAAVRDGHWTPGKELGQGQFGTVRMAIMPGGNCLAVKQVSTADLFAEGDDGDEARDAYKKEISMMVHLNHPNIVRYYGVNTSSDGKDSFLNLFMEYVAGGSLGEMARALDAAMDEITLAGYMRQILLGLGFLHGKKIMHRDVKGDNCLLSPQEGLVKLTDFGSAKRLQKSIQGPKSVVGTPNFMAPEIITQGEDAGAACYNFKVDIWSLGCTAIELLAQGTPPWSKYTSAWACIYHIANSKGEPEGIPETTSQLCREFLSKCFKRDADERADVTELLQDPFIEQAPESITSAALADQEVLGVGDAMDLLKNVGQNQAHADPKRDDQEM